MQTAQIQNIKARHISFFKDVRMAVVLLLASCMPRDGEVIKSTHITCTISALSSRGRCLCGTQRTTDTHTWLLSLPVRPETHTHTSAIVAAAPSRLQRVSQHSTCFFLLIEILIFFILCVRDQAQQVSV